MTDFLPGGLFILVLLTLLRNRLHVPRTHLLALTIIPPDEIEKKKRKKEKKNIN